MKASHKLQKLFSADWLLSAVDHARRWSHPVDWQAMLRAVDPAQLAALQARYVGPGRTEDVGDSAKFANAGYWLKRNVERAQDSDLDRSPPIRILDLGCGAGWFLYVCRKLGHEAVGFDLDENPLYRDMLALLGAQRVVGRIEAFHPVPAVEGKFDLITSHCICFQKFPSWKDGDKKEWGVEEWRFFLDDVRTRLLTETGRIMLDFNPRGGGVHYPVAVGEFFRREGGQIFRSKVLLDRVSPATVPVGAS